MTRNWRALVGQTFDLDGIRFRVVQGKKAADDLKIEWWTPMGWVPLRFLTVGVIADFLMFNEDTLYPPAKGFQGGKKLLAYLAQAYRSDIDRAEAGLQAEKAAKTARLFDPDLRAS